MFTHYWPRFHGTKPKNLNFRQKVESPNINNDIIMTYLTTLKYNETKTSTSPKPIFTGNTASPNIWKLKGLKVKPETQRKILRVYLCYVCKFCTVICTLHGAIFRWFSRKNKKSFSVDVSSSKWLFLFWKIE